MTSVTLCSTHSRGPPGIAFTFQTPSPILSGHPSPPAWLLSFLVLSGPRAGRPVKVLVPSPELQESRPHGPLMASRNLDDGSGGDDAAQIPALTYKKYHPSFRNIPITVKNETRKPILCSISH